MRAIQAWIMGLWLTMRLTMVPLRLTVLCLRLTMMYLGLTTTWAWLSMLTIICSALLNRPVHHGSLGIDGSAP